jgi:hypothetical protein
MQPGLWCPYFSYCKLTVLCIKYYDTTIWKRVRLREKRFCVSATHWKTLLHKNFLAFFLHGNKNLLSAMYSSDTHDEMKKEWSLLSCYYARGSECRFMSGVDIIAPVLQDIERHSFLFSNTCYCCTVWTYDKFTPVGHVIFMERRSFLIMKSRMFDCAAKCQICFMEQKTVILAGSHLSSVFTVLVFLSSS